LACRASSEFQITKTPGKGKKKSTPKKRTKNIPQEWLHTELIFLLLDGVFEYVEPLQKLLLHGLILPSHVCCDGEGVLFLPIKISQELRLANSHR
jgi:hypothetical protein